MSMRTWTNEQLIEAVNICNTYAGVARKLGLTNYGANSKTIKKYIVELNLNTEHFLTRGEQLKIARGSILKLPFDKIFSINNIDRKHIKKRIIDENFIPYQCQMCGIFEWHGQKLSLHLDHINGTNNDNRLENLRFLCPNCHSLTETYCANNMKPAAPKHCLDCGQKINKKSTRCERCAAYKQKTKIIWPTTKQLIKLVAVFGYTKTGKQLGVSGPAIKKRIRNHPND